MAGHDLGLQVVYRGEALEYYRPGGWVFFQRPKGTGWDALMMTFL